MAKNKPNLAFLEALQQEKKRHGDEKKPGGSFRTPEWFFNQQQGKPAGNPSAISLGYMPAKSPRGKFLYVLIIILAAGLLAILTYAFLRTSGAPKAIPSGAGTPAENQGDNSKLPPPNPLPRPDTAAQTPPDGHNTPETSVQRTAGLNYVVIKSYKDVKLAAEAADVLHKGGIECTVERDLPYAPGWYLVVGTKGFERANDSVPEYRDYKKSIMAISDKFSAIRKSKRFEPNAYKWK